MPILIPLAAGAIAVVGAILLHGLSVSATVNLLRYEQRSGRAGATFSADVAIVAIVMLVLLVAHLIEVAVWPVPLGAANSMLMFGVSTAIIFAVLVLTRFADLRLALRS